MPVCGPVLSQVIVVDLGVPELIQLIDAIVKLLGQTHRSVVESK